MNAILGIAEIQLQNESLDRGMRDALEKIYASGDLLLGIINDILDFSKIESGKLELNPIDYDFNAFTDHLKSMFDYIAQKKGLEFILECSGDLPECLFGDDLRLRQTLTNIVGNAVKFTQEGYVCLRITHSDGRLTFEIEDTGIGIRKEDLPKLFHAFEQVDKSKNRNVVGTGLGLTICKSFIEMMGGTITLDSVYGQGTTFTISIPAVIGSKEKMIQNKADVESRNISAPGAKVLIVDDNEFNLKVAHGLLSLLDINAETVDSGFKAVELVKQNDYDIVFMDHMMPEMDGVETTSLIRGLGDKYSSLPVIALTANAIHGAKEMFLESGFNDFISKPINSSELVRVLEEWLPSEKIQAKDAPEDPQELLSKEEQLRRKSIVTFVKDNQNTFEAFSGALSSGDIKTAHRLAHTLKSSAGYLGKRNLQHAAAVLEEALQDGIDHHTPEQLDSFEWELEKALNEFKPFVAEAQENKKDAVEVGADEVKQILDEVKPFLEKGDFAAVDYVEKLQGIAGLENLAALIDDYDFEGALALLNTLG
jgi:CheY-like chemotaxis protein